jgi:predicted dehydrogenase
MNLIQVGVGGWGQSWLPRVQRHPDASLAALVDVDPAALEVAREQTGLSASRCFASVEEALGKVEADAVLNVTPPALHHQVALAAFEHGLHVLTEKPIADTMSHGRRMVDAARDSRRTLMVSQNYRFRPWARTMRRPIGSGRFGPPDSVSVRFARALRIEGAPAVAAHPLVRDMSIHHFDLMRAVTGREPLLVYGRTWQPQWSWFEDDPCAAALFEFEGGMEVIYEGTWVTRGRETTWDGYWAVECPEGVVELRADRVHVVPAGHPDEDSEVELKRQPRSGQSAALSEFVAAVTQGREPETSGRDNLRSLAMSFAVMESARTGRAVQIEQVLES